MTNSIKIGYYERKEANWSQTGQDIHGYWGTRDGKSFTINAILELLSGEVVEATFYSEDDFKAALKFFFGEGYWFACKNAKDYDRCGRYGYRFEHKVSGTILFDL